MDTSSLKAKLLSANDNLLYALTHYRCLFFNIASISRRIAAKFFMTAEKPSKDRGPRLRYYCHIIAISACSETNIYLYDDDKINRKIHCLYIDTLFYYVEINTPCMIRII